jgi:GTP-binding protein
MFIDQARLHVQAGDGGRGAISFRREKFVPRGGPDGGDGGNGGDVYLKATASKNTLVDFQFLRHFKAGRGQHGSGGKRTGKSGDDLIIPVPVGTIIYDGQSGDVIADLDQDGASVIVVRGGRGGKGNAHFATPTAQAPEFAQEGEEGEAKYLNLELKLLADAGLLGFPNAGKSTLLSKVSAARPKIASYPFTTLQPVLGVVHMPDDTSFVLADIPGLIEGASQGTGLGLEFLRHIERTRVLLHLVDVSSSDELSPVRRYEILRKELADYGRGLSRRPQIVVASKVDQADPVVLSEFRKYARRKHLDYLEISSLTGEGIQELLQKVQQELAAVTPENRSGRAIPR